MKKTLSAFSIILICIISFSSYSQYFPPKDYPHDYFRNPLGIPLQLSANFGELRTNHFHMGFDIRTNQRENLPVCAAAEGYISRVKIERFGFGRAIYITHPYGYTTLYAHLNDFYKELDEYVKSIQYKDEKWEQDINIPAGLFPVTKGQFIAFSGNTGGSAGPHLHFEIRDTKTENNLNPWLFNFSLADNIQPYIYSLYYYDRRYSTYQISPTKISIKGAKGAYTSTDSVVVVNTPQLSFGIKSEDKTNSSPFLFGIYAAEVWVDDSLTTAFELDNFSYNESRYINGSIDYRTKANGGGLIQHLSRLPGNHIQIFSPQLQNGVIDLSDTLVHAVVINVKDAAGNNSSLRFKVRFNPSRQQDYMFTTNTFPVIPNQESNVKLDDIAVDFNNNAVYDYLPLIVKSTDPTEKRTVSRVHVVHNITAPVHDSFTVRIKRTVEIPDSLKNKVVMQLLTKGDKEAVKSVWKGDWLEGKYRDFGTIKLIIDTTPPFVMPMGWKNGANLKAARSITFLCRDDAGELKSFRAELDGQWLMFSRKSDYFIYKFDEHISAGPHVLKVKVEDAAGNITERTYSFTR
jgi:hypothetical protein